MTLPASVPPRPTLRVRLAGHAETKIRQGHPWIFSESITEQNRDGDAGELAVVFDRHDRFLAAGLYDPGSPIRIRVLHAGKPRKLDDAWWEERLQEALARRGEVLEPGTDGLRWINGESDGWPALVLDQYDGVLVLKLYSAAWFPHLGRVAALIAGQLKPKSVVLRLSRNILDAARKAGLADGATLAGEPVTEPVTFSESGLRFQADVIKGQKTGFFLDQRENRRKVEALSKGRSVLNLFSFTGGFSLYAARGGAAAVTSVDISAHALAELRQNWRLNTEAGSAGIAACPHDEVQADVFEWLGATDRHYDLVVIDPPSLAKKERERDGAVRAYENLATLGLRRLRKGGVLVCASCSAHVSSEEFVRAVRRAVRLSARAMEEVEVTGHAPDHPATIGEMRYLKAVYFREM
jgi:23S rRNA (cytosine1962-C5)-methyltransferase